MSSQAPAADRKWWIGQVNFNAYRVNFISDYLYQFVLHVHDREYRDIIFQLVFEVFHANNNKKTGYAAVDSITFDNNPQCEIIPPDADPSHSTTASTTPDTGKFPDCQFEEDECGWVKDEEANMKWRRTNKMELDGEGLDSPNYDYKGYFIYVGAQEGAKNGTTTLATPMAKSPVTGCLNFHFSMTVFSSLLL